MEFEWNQLVFFLINLMELMSWNLFIFIESKKFGFSGFY